MCYVEYTGYPGVFHTRLCLDLIHGEEWVIATPDGDMYPEVLSSGNPDFSRFFHVTDGSFPPRIPRNQIYAFQPMTAGDYARLLSRGQSLGRGERAQRGLAPGHGVGGPLAAPAPLAGDQNGEEYIWVLAEMVPGHKIGEEVIVPAGAPREGDHALVHVVDSSNIDHIVRALRYQKDEVGALCEETIQNCRNAIALHGEDTEASADVRTLSIKYNVNGERYRDFRASLDDMRQVEFDDFPLEPRTSLDYLRAVSELSESCYGQHLSWCQNSRIPDGDRSIWENETLSRAIDLGIRYDCLNIANLASFELLIRRKQLIAEAHVGTPGAPSYEGSDYYMGVRHRPGGGIIVPSLQEYVARRMHEDSQIQKEKRKLREQKEAAKGAGKNKSGAPPNSSTPPKAEGGGPKSEKTVQLEDSGRPAVKDLGPVIFAGVLFLSGNQCLLFLAPSWEKVVVEIFCLYLIWSWKLVFSRRASVGK